jgi:hypothetical protein
MPPPSKSRDSSRRRKPLEEQPPNREEATTNQTPRAMPKPLDEFELNLPAGFTSDGSRMATLREILDPQVATRSLLQLSSDHRFDLAAKRIEMRPDDFELILPGYGTVDKSRAVAEVRARTKIGRYLVEVEETAVKRATRQGRTEQREKSRAR